MPLLGILVSAIIAGSVIGLIFNALYPSVPIGPELAFFFALVGFGLIFGLRLLWQTVKSKPE